MMTTDVTAEEITAVGTSIGDELEVEELAMETDSSIGGLTGGVYYWTALWLQFLHLGENTE